MKSKTVSIIGGGISGLSAAFWLIQEDPEIEITIIEKQNKVGGWIQTEVSESLQIYESGPRTLRATKERGKALYEMITILGLDTELIFQKPSASLRYMYLDGAPYKMPSSFFEACCTRNGRKIIKSLFLEPFQAIFRKRGTLESVGDFIRRVFPNNTLLYDLMDCYTAGVWAADADSVSAHIALPYITELEARYGSIVIGSIIEWSRSLFRRKEEGSRIFSFHNGLGVLINRLESYLTSRGVKIYCNTTVDGIEKHGASWESVCRSQQDSFSIISDRLIFAADPAACSNKIKLLFEKELSHIRRSSVVSIACGWKEDLFLDVPRKIDQAFGILAPRSSDDRVLGIVIDSALFEAQTRSMKTRMTVMIGGTRYPSVMEESADQLILLAKDRLKSWLGIFEEPDEILVFFAPSAITIPTPSKYLLPPFYCVESASLYWASSAIGAVSVPDCVAATQKLAKSLKE